MTIVSSLQDEAVAAALNSGQLVVLRTDTIYGIVARADDEQAVENLYKVKQRSTEKRCINLVADVTDIPNLSATQAKRYRQLAEQRPTSIEVEKLNQPDWLTRGHRHVSYRVPTTRPDLIQLLEKVGQLVAPSANPESQPPAQTVAEAISYFGDQVAVYVDGDAVPVDATASQLVCFRGDDTVILRG